MQTDLWGPDAWSMLHNVSFGSPEILDEDDKINYTSFYTNIKCILPCSLCRTAFKNMIDFVKITDYIDGRDGLCYWVFIIHNLVNRKLGKDLESFDNVIYKYENMRSICGKNDGSKKYTDCKNTKYEYTLAASKNKAISICEKYKEISHTQILNYYYSDKIIDPNFAKCSV